MRFLKRLVLAVSGALLLTTGLGVSPASAAPDSTCGSIGLYGKMAGRGCFYHSGDIITVEDTLADGLRVVVDWSTDYGRDGTCQNAYGANDRVVTCNYDMKESGVVNFLVCLRDGANGPFIGCNSRIYVDIGTGKRL
ncbi:hypothetical protein [Streptomyces sp. NPDC049881]|uniref:hypothetical protein n=1 Tax=Streptomyces sp. NPDC049881 TaxID=3155778 RepID=UPI00344875EE